MIAALQHLFFFWGTLSFTLLQAGSAQNSCYWRNTTFAYLEKKAGQLSNSDLLVLTNEISAISNEFKLKAQGFITGYATRSDTSERVLAYRALIEKIKIAQALVGQEISADSSALLIEKLGRAKEYLCNFERDQADFAKRQEEDIMAELVL